jgi:hypothetical protein
VADEAAYTAKHADFCARNRAGKTTTKTAHVNAYLNNGRWVADCACGAGMGAYPGWASRCFGCGAIYTTVRFPKDWADGEDVLWARPRRDHEWPATKTVADLIAERDALLSVAADEEIV